MNERMHRLGDLEPLAAWIESVRGIGSEPDTDSARGAVSRAFTRPTLVVFCGDHGIAQRDVSAYSAGYSARRFRSISDGTEAVSRLADTRGVHIAAVDVCLDHSFDPPGEPHGAPFTPSEPIDIADAMTATEVHDAIEFGAGIADREIDSGADLLLLGDMGRASTAVAATIISVIADVEPLKCVGRGSGVDDAGWMRKMTAVRDARRRAMPHQSDPMELLRVSGGADLAAAVGFLQRAALRRVPVVIDGVVGMAVALLTQELNPAASRGWQVARRSDEPAQLVAITRLGLRPILDLTLPFGEGIGTLLALAVLQGAATLAEESN